MKIKSENYSSIADKFLFHHESHKELALHFLTRLSEALDFTIVVQKATLRLETDEAFGVVGLRRSQETIFVEFYVKQYSDLPRIVKQLTSKDGKSIERVTIASTKDVEEELIALFVASKSLCDVNTLFAKRY